MNRIFFVIAALAMVIPLRGQTPIDVNYVRNTTTTQLDNGIPSKHIITYTYIDGLGRPIQQVTQQGSPSKKDIIQPIVYDEFGRERRRFFPFTADNTNGAYTKTDEIINSSFAYIGIAKTFYEANSDNKIADDSRPYSEMFFEPSPLNRPEKEYGAGFAWSPGEDNKFIRHQYLTNKHNVNGTQSEEAIIAWSLNEQSLPTAMTALSGTIEDGGYYSSNQLNIKVTVDEEGHAVREYINKLGQVVLKKVQVASGQPNLNTQTAWASTYYIYDELDNLRCVIPPEAVARLATEYYHGTANNTTKETFLSQWAFRYIYDERRRMSHKQVPGANAVYMVYDGRDRLIMTQDGNQRDKPTKEWTFTKYDAFNRPILTGIYFDAESLSQSAMQLKVNTFYNPLSSTNSWFEEQTNANAVHGYTNKSFPLVSDLNNFLTVTYYDNYKFQSLIPNASAFSYDDDQIVASGSYKGQDANSFDRVQGVLTGTKIKNLETNEWMWSVNHYDDRYRIIQNISNNSKGGIDKNTNVYDEFQGRVDRTKTEHTVAGNTKSVTRNFTYDNMSRLLQTEHQIDGGTPVVLSNNEYNELGQLVTKKLHQLEDEPDVIPDPLVGQPGVVYAKDIVIETYDANVVAYVASNSITIKPGFSIPAGGTLVARLGYSQEDADALNNASGTFAQEIDYRYNIRGWLDNINDVDAAESNDLFSMDLNYHTPLADGGDPQYNGNISQALWKGPDGKKKSYGYYYDPMNRLKEGKYFEGTINGRYTENLGDVDNAAYDLNGNIQNLFRYGKIGEDPVTGKVLYGLMDDLLYTYSGNQLTKVDDDAADTEGFKDVVNTEDYDYDPNGNMQMDKNKSLNEGSITYNYLNLPQLVQKTTTAYVRYTYDATGRKLKQLAVDETEKTTEYLGEFLYENGNLQLINHDEGRVVMTGQTPEYQYFLKDHLGNVRTTFTTKEEETESVLATLETANETNDRGYFLKYDDVRTVNHALFDHTNTGDTKYAVRLTGTEEEMYGLARSISVMPGDKVKASVFAKYIDFDESDVEAQLFQLLAMIANGPSSGIVADGPAYNTPAGRTIPFPGLFEDEGETGDDLPEAYLNWLVFDKDFNFIPSKSKRKRITESARENGNIGGPNGAEGANHEKIISDEIEITEAGFVYIYFSNNEPGYEVYFDDFEVEQVKSNIVGADDYYPFGLTFNSYRRENSLDQSYQYNGKELQDELDLGWLDYGARMYQPDLGRWFAIDPLADIYSPLTPYNYVGNSPIGYIDPNGTVVTISFIGTNAAEARRLFEQVVNNILSGQFVATLKDKGNGAYTLGLANARDSNGKTIQGDPNKLSKGGREFYNTLKEKIDDPDNEAKLSIDFATAKAHTGDHGLQLIDMADIMQFPVFDNSKSVQDGPTQAGKIIHEIVEQWNKAYRVNLGGDPTKSDLDHQAGIGAENAAHGYTKRWNPDYIQNRNGGVEQRFDHKNGTTTRYLVTGGQNSPIKPVVTVTPLPTIKTPEIRRKQ